MPSPASSETSNEISSPTATSARAARPRLVRGTRPPEIPLSFPQRGLWFLSRLEDSAPSYNEQVALRFAGRVDLDTLSAALDDLLERHESLRTIFPERHGVPSQHVLDVSAARPDIVTIETTEEELRRQMIVATQRRFDLRVEPPFRAHLFELPTDEHVLLLVMHHIAMDGWSVQRVLVRDLVKAYEARRCGVAPDLPPLPVQYADYTLWQVEMLGREDDPASMAARQLAFWTRTLEGLPDPWPLPTDRPRPAVPGFRGGAVTLLIDRPLHTALLALARSQRASTFMLLHAAVAALLTRMGAGSDIPVGSPVSGRKTPLVNELVGFFANTLVIRTDTSANPTFRSLLARVRRTVLDACAHDDLPFGRLVEALNPSRSLARNPLFQVMLVFQTASPTIASDLTPGGGIGRVQLRDGTPTRFDLTFEFFERRIPGGIQGTLYYSTDLFDAETAELMAARLIKLLEAVAADPDCRIEDVDLLDAAERRRILEEWATSDRAAPDDDDEIGPPLPARFERQAAQTPLAAAVLCEGRSLTYAALNERANRLARVLASRGIGPEPEQIVAVAVPRREELVVCLLAVLKAGAACLPLDPEHPSRLLADALAQARPRVVLTTSDAVRTLPRDIPLIVVDEPDDTAVDSADDSSRWVTVGPVDDPLPAPLLDARGAFETRDSVAAKAPEPRLLPDHPAYVFNTAGRGGAPRPIVTTHRGLVTLLSNMQQIVPLDVSDRLLATSTVTSDLAIVELLHPLLNGAAVVLASSSDLLYTDDLLDTLARERITVVQATPDRFRAWAGTHHPDAPRLRWLVGRDAVHSSNLDTARRAGHEVVHLYGTTETTVWSTSAHDSINIGRPLPGSRIYVLDTYLRPSPTGVPGEVYISGASLARGYLNRSSLTAAHFVADRFGPAGARMFRTGDRARWKHDGSLEFMGRADDRVTIGGGLSIDMRLVTRALLACDGVRDAMAVITSVTNEERQTPRLVAYVIAASGQPQPLDLDALRSQLERALPKHMMPAAIVPIDAWPTTPGGAVDREALPPPVFRAREKRPPRTPDEHALCALFSEVLSAPDVGLDDNFFELGGHSLLVTKLINRVRSTLGIELEIRTLFDAPTVAGLAARLEEYV